MKTVTKKSTGLGVALCAVVVLLASAGPARAAIYAFDDFSNNLPDPKFQTVDLSTSGAPHFNGPPTYTYTGQLTIGPSPDDVQSRGAVQTIRADFATVPFIFQADVTVKNSPGDPWTWGWFGMGPSVVGGGEPSSPRVMAIFSGPNRYGNEDNGAANYAVQTLSGNTADPDRVMMTWDPVTQQAFFQIDHDYAGGTFTPDYSFTINGADNGFTGLNSPLMVGGGEGIVFDNIEIFTVPEPSTVLLFGLGGLLFGWWRRRMGNK